METNVQHKILLQRHDLWRTNRIEPGSCLSCDTGVLWVTQTGDLADHILLPGDMVTIAQRGKVLVEAMRDAAFHVA